MRRKHKLFNHIDINVVCLGEGEKYRHKNCKQEMAIDPGFDAQVFYLNAVDSDTLGAVVALFGDKMPPIDTIVHECWHIFCGIYNQIESSTVSFDELRKEAYAYNFESLFGFVYGTLQGFYKEDK